LDDVAKEAGVGAGTLYRHFPTRDALIEAVYRTEVRSWLSQQRLLTIHASGGRTGVPGCCLFVDYIAAKQIIAPALNSS